MKLELSEALDAMAKRMVNGNGIEPSPLNWDDLDLSIKNSVREQMIGPLHAAVEALKPQIEREYAARLAVLS